MAYGLPALALSVTLINMILLSIRIRAENAALSSQ